MTSHDKSPALIVRAECPFNGGPPLDLLRQSFLTPNNLFFVRNHGDVPLINPHEYRLTVDGRVRRPLSLSLDDLRADFPEVTVVAALQCAGNRRDGLSAIQPVLDELPWESDAIGNAAWTGVPLRDVLHAADVEPGAQHAAFLGLDTVEHGAERFGYGSSIPLDKALQPEVLLAYAMNGAPLPPTHGFPLRVVTPGYIGARSVKWLASITLQSEPSDNYFQSHAYKLFPPQIDAETADWNVGLMLGELSINAVICSPVDGAVLPAGSILVQGYAMAGGGRTVERVDLSIDGGVTWSVAELGEQQPWAWRFWAAQLSLPPGPHEIIARAWDSAANTQPEHAHAIWNFKGYMNNAWHRVRVRVTR
jgi:sulfite oxidase